jgi:hypothetical protein
MKFFKKKKSQHTHGKLLQPLKFYELFRFSGPSSTSIHFPGFLWYNEWLGETFIFFFPETN